MKCPTCNMPWGRCTHTSEGQVTTQRTSQRAVAALLGTLPRLSAEDVSDPYAARAGTVGQDPALVASSPAIAADSNKRPRNTCLYDPKCRELAEYFAAGNEPHLTDEQLDDLSQDFQDAAESYLRLVESEGQS